MDGPTVTFIIFGIVQFLALLGVIWTNKIDTKILAVRLDNMNESFRKVEGVVTELVNQSNRLYLIEDRQLALRKTVDEQVIRFNKYIDKFILDSPDLDRRTGRSEGRSGD